MFDFWKFFIPAKIVVTKKLEKELFSPLLTDCFKAANWGRDSKSLHLLSKSDFNIKVSWAAWTWVLASHLLSWTTWVSTPAPASLQTTWPWATWSHPATGPGWHLCRHWAFRPPGLWIPLYQHAGWLGSGGLASGMVRGLAGIGDIQSEKETMQ